MSLNGTLSGPLSPNSQTGNQVWKWSLGVMAILLTALVATYILCKRGHRNVADPQSPTVPNVSRSRAVEKDEDDEGMEPASIVRKSLAQRHEIALEEEPSYSRSAIDENHSNNGSTYTPSRDEEISSNSRLVEESQMDSQSQSRIVGGRRPSWSIPSKV
jgi:hypothetical protein